MGDFSSTYARRLLEKYGWTKGSGLGKNNDGISKPIKVKKKFSRLGLGAPFDPSKKEEEFFSTLYNLAVSRVGGRENSIPEKSTDSSVPSITTYDPSKVKRHYRVAFKFQGILNGSEEVADQRGRKRKRQWSPTCIDKSSDSSSSEEENHSSSKSEMLETVPKSAPSHSFSCTNLLKLGKSSRKRPLRNGKLTRAAEFI
ncbi:hypothetical protein Aperf_G00000088853 [Anoplocephala perfoliata]